MKNYFDGCTTLDALKARYRIMAKELHPDLHPELGDEPMKELNAQFERLSERLSHVAADGRTEATAEQAEQARADADAYRAVIMQIIHLAGLEIELCGAWLWVSGISIHSPHTRGDSISLQKSIRIYVSLHNKTMIHRFSGLYKPLFCGAKPDIRGAKPTGKP